MMYNEMFQDLNLYFFLQMFFFVIKTLEKLLGIHKVLTVTTEKNKLSVNRSNQCSTDLRDSGKK